MINKLFWTVAAVLFLSSCGPQRMGCGARGICQILYPEYLQAKMSTTVKSVG